MFSIVKCRLRVGGCPWGDTSVLPLLIKLHEKLQKLTDSWLASGSLSSASRSEFSIKLFLATEAEAGAGLLLVIFCIYQAYLHRIYEQLLAAKQGLSS